MSKRKEEDTDNKNDETLHNESQDEEIIETREKRTRKAKNKNPAGDNTAAVDVVAPVPILEVRVLEGVAEMPTRRVDGLIVFHDHPEFTPNVTPAEILQAGAFGGTYFRPIHSRVTGQDYSGVWRELPAEWLQGLDIKLQIARPKYNKSVNKYKESCGGDLDRWESSGWITAIDPYGWFQVERQ